jgi:hypothetical protein
MAVLEGHTVAEELDIGLAAVHHIVAAAGVHRTGRVEVLVVRHTVLVVVHHTVPAEAAHHTVQVVAQGVRHTVLVVVHHTGLVGEAVRPIAVAEEVLHTGLEVALRTD